MTWKDKLEIGLKKDAPYRRDNVPDDQRTSRVSREAPGDDRSPEDEGARARGDASAGISTPRKVGRTAEGVKRTASKRGRTKPTK